ncbi:MAG TPA: MFS transporter, partial [Terriglobia bacterium]|nr:MFS transporter [Terriglobia bacterium]
SLPALIAFRCVQGVGAAMLLAGSVALLSALAGSTARGVAVWTAAGTFGAALGPALGGVLTQLFDWRAIFVFQAPVALIALVAAFESQKARADAGFAAA